MGGLDLGFQGFDWQTKLHRLGFALVRCAYAYIPYIVGSLGPWSREKC